jgi:hypothetical protein
MKNLFFVLLACLLTACFRTPDLSTLSTHSPILPAVEAAATLPPDPDEYVSAGRVAAAGSAFSQERESCQAAVGTNGETSAPAVTIAGPTTHLAISGSKTAVGDPQSALPHLPARREVRKAVRKILAGGSLAARTQDDPVVPRRSGLALAALIAGIGGLALFVLGIAASASATGIGSALFLFSFIGGILAVVFGAVAKGKVRDGLAPRTDRGRATAGFILGLVNLSLFLLLTLLFIAIIIAWGGGI